MVFLVINSLSGQQNSILVQTEEDIECAIKPVEIKSFKDNTERVKFQIVAGRPIGYSAAKGEDTSPFTWHLFKDHSALGFEYVYTLEGINPTTMAKSGTAEIAINTLDLFNSNQYFGQATVKVDNATGGMVEKEVKIFYEKEAIHPVSGNPNWFDYWQDNTIIESLLNSVPKIKMFDISTCEFVEQSGNNPILFSYAPDYDYFEDYLPDRDSISGDYGSHRSYAHIIAVGEGTPFCQDKFQVPTKVGYQPEVEISIKLGPGASRKKFAWNRSNNFIEGIHVYYSTLVHEVEHARIFYDNWKDGYSLDLFDKDKDNYHDDWEGIANSEMTESDFSPKPKGRFSDELGIDSYHRYHPDSLFQDPPKVSAGTDYEEWRCLKKEYDLFSQLYEIDEYDWSYDPPVEIYEDPRLRTQGKQWKN